MLKSAKLNRDPGIVAAFHDSPPLSRRPGATSSVKILQRVLIDLGFRMPRTLRENGTTDGVFGAETEDAVKLFQKTCQLKADGVVGRHTLAALDKILYAQYLTSVAAYQAAIVSRSNWGMV